MDPAARLAAEVARLRALPPALPDGRVLVALSGGGDSTALLVLALESGPPVVAAHLDHAMRPASGEEAARVSELCTRLGVELRSERVDVPAVAAARRWSPEDAARRVRYDFLSRAAREAGCVAVLTGHTLEDDAETVLLQLLRGTARATGIPPRQGRVLRPLLGVRREALRELLRERAIGWVEDDSNSDAVYTRNWLRQRVLPLLAERFPGAHDSLARYASVSRDEDVLLEALAAEVPPGADWRREPLALRRRLVRRALEGAGTRPDREHLDAILAALEGTGLRRLSLPGGLTARAGSGRLTILRDPSPAHLSWPEGLDFSAYPGAELRTRRPGDRVRMPGGTRKLSDVFIDRKVPREERDAIPVVAIGQEVLWAGTVPPLLDVRLGVARDEDHDLMAEALALAREAAAEGEVPVGAVVARAGQVIGRGRNRSRADGDMTLHAELEALRQAAGTAGPYLDGCTLYVTLEPCPMCLGAAIEARASRIVYAAPNPKAGALGGVRDLLRAPWTHRPAVRGGVRAQEAAALLSAFFSALRSEA
ncbi:MAG TPA: tRNA lysidine(34) synthetase TilS [Deinococcales bacterium]|nr:tRNA lysidine(34) synthetase TilS [Deinococcales bacterium]